MKLTKKVKRPGVSAFKAFYFSLLYRSAIRRVFFCEIHKPQRRKDAEIKKFPEFFGLAVGSDQNHPVFLHSIRCVAAMTAVLHCVHGDRRIKTTVNQRRSLDDRPGRSFVQKGTMSLSDAELIAILDSGRAPLNECGGSLEELDAACRK